MSHTIHEDSHTHGLADGCPRCKEHASHPLNSLDDTNLKNLIQRVVENEKPRSDNEEQAMNNVEHALQMAGALLSTDGESIAQYMNRVYGIRLVVMK